MRQRGYSLVELVVAMGIMSILLLALNTFIFNSTQNIANEDTKTALSDNTRTAIEGIAREIRTAKSVESSNSQPDSNSPSAPGNLYSWAASAGSNATLVLAVPARRQLNLQ
jgi:prepilin-type N-terminal cleavage/methylation domain-containing protein